MFGTIRKHQNWLWAVIIAVIIISFVLFFSPYSRFNNNVQSDVNFGSINGEKISQEQLGDAYREVQLRYFFNNGNFAGEEAKARGFDPEREAYQWLLLIQQANKMGIRISPTDVARVAQGMLSQFQNQKTGITSPEMFIRQVLQPRNFQADDLERFVRHYLSVQELIGVVGLGGKLVTPEEAQSLYEREHQEVATEAVFFTGSNYMSSAPIPDAALNQFYTNRLAFYRVPERIQVKFVEFGISNYLTRAEATLMKTNLNEAVDSMFQRIGTNYSRLAKTPEEAKVKIRQEMIKDEARKYAKQEAAAFASPLFDLEPMQAGNLEVVAQKKGLPVRLSKPFDRETGPQDIDVTMDFAQKAFTRSAADPFAGPLEGREAVYVIALEKNLPSEVPTLDQIRDKVTLDYKTFRALNEARMEGVRFDSTLTNELATGKPFSSICLNAKLKPVSLTPFSISTPELPDIEGRLTINQLKQLAFSTPVGSASSFQPTPDGGVVLYVKSKLPIDLSRMNSELPAFISRVRVGRENDAFQDWFRKEAEKGLRDIPALNRQQQPQPNMGAPASQKRS